MIPATEHTAYHLASLTKTFASTILMQLVQDGKIKLDDPVSKYGITLESDGVIRVRATCSPTHPKALSERRDLTRRNFRQSVFHRQPSDDESGVGVGVGCAMPGV